MAKKEERIKTKKINQKKKKNLRNYFWELIYEEYKTIVEKINNISDHQGEVGDDNADFVIELMNTFLPIKYKIEKKRKILSKLGKQSSEHDIIIWNQNEHPPIFPQILKKNFRYFLIEMVSACIEVKTTLNKKKLEDAFLKIRDFRREMLEGIHATYFYGPKSGYHEPLYFIFAFDTNWKKFSTIIRNIEDIIKENDIKPHERFDYLFILKKGIIIQWVIPEQFNDTKSIKEENKKDKKDFEKDNMSKAIKKNIFCFPSFDLNIIFEKVTKEAPIIMSYDKTQLFSSPFMRRNIQFFPSMLINEDHSLDNSSEYKLRFIIEQIISGEKGIKFIPDLEVDLYKFIQRQKVFTNLNISPLTKDTILEISNKDQIIALRKFLSTLCKALQDRKYIPAGNVIDESYYELIKFKQSYNSIPF